MAPSTGELVPAVEVKPAGAPGVLEAELWRPFIEAARGLGEEI